MTAMQTKHADFDVKVAHVQLLMSTERLLKAADDVRCDRDHLLDLVRQSDPDDGRYLAPEDVK